MASGGAGEDGGLLAWLWAGLAGAVVTLGGAAATAWTWMRRIRAQARADRKKEFDAQGVSYRDLLDRERKENKAAVESIRADLGRVQERLNAVEEEHVECRVSLARLEERSARLELEASEARTELAELRKQKGG